MKLAVLMLTIFRILAGPLILLSLVYFDWLSFALFLFILASITDYLDGTLARHFNVVTPIGEILDPIADKILLVFGLIAMILSSQDVNIAVISAIILSREFWVAGLRDFNARMNRISLTNVSFLSKIKTSTQFLSILFYFVGLSFNLALVIFISKFLLFLAMLLAIQTCVDYTRKSLWH